MALRRGLFAGMSPEVGWLKAFVLLLPFVFPLSPSPLSPCFCLLKFVPLEQRVDPGRIEPSVRSIPKIISALEDMIPGSLANIKRVYDCVFDRTVTVSQPEVAEMTKLYENSQRMMAIAFANEMADACIPHGIDPFQVAAAASTKPFGYLPVTPSIGVGGHCIPVNPYYLQSNGDFPLLIACTEKMRDRPGAIARRAIKSLNIDSKLTDSDSGINIPPNILVVGVGFKRGEAVLSNSPGVQLIQELANTDQVNVMWADPLVNQDAVPVAPRLPDHDWTKEGLEDFDIIIVAVNQVGLDLELLKSLKKRVKVQTWATP